MIFLRNRVLGLALLAGLETMYQRPKGRAAKVSSRANLELEEGDEV